MSLNWRSYIIIAYLWFVILLRTWTYPLKTYRWYQEQDPGYITVTQFCMFMKIILNKDSHLKRSSVRNVVFDCLRVQFASFFYPLVFSGAHAIDFQSMKHTFFQVAFLSVLVNTNLNTKKIKKQYQIIWSILLLEFVSLFGQSMVTVLNKLEKTFKMSPGISLLMVFTEMHLTLGWEWLEDIVFGDMNQSYGLNKGPIALIKDNLGTYLSGQIMFPVLFVLQHTLYGEFLETNPFDQKYTGRFKWNMV